MTYNILFAVVGIGLIALGLSLMKLDSLAESCMMETLHNAKLINDIDSKRSKDSCRLDEAFRRIQALEEQLEEKLNDFGGEE